MENMGRVGERISQHERRAMEAERETIDRYVAAFLAAHVGDLVEARITGVQSFGRSEEHTSELQSLMRISYAVFCLKKKNKHTIYMYHTIMIKHVTLHISFTYN